MNPIVVSSTPPSPVPAGGPPAGKAAGTILVVDDEQSVLLMVKRMLERIGFTVVTAPGGREAVSTYAARPGDFACVLLDLTMPVVDGRRTFDELKQIRGDVKVIISSGGSGQDVVNELADRGLAGFIQKPYSAAALADALRGVLDTTRS